MSHRCCRLLTNHGGRSRAGRLLHQTAIILLCFTTLFPRNDESAVTTGAQVGDSEELQGPPRIEANGSPLLNPSRSQGLTPGDHRSQVGGLGNLRGPVRDYTEEKYR